MPLMPLSGEMLCFLYSFCSPSQHLTENLRVFSTVNVIKVDKRATLSNESLDDLLVLNADKIPIEDFTPDHSIDRWWE